MVHQKLPHIHEEYPVGILQATGGKLHVSVDVGCVSRVNGVCVLQFGAYPLQSWS